MDAARRPHSLGTGAFTDGAALLPSIHQEGLTAAHRLSRWALLITAERESFCDTLRFAHRIHSLQLLLIELIKRQLDQTDGAEQIAVVLQALLSDDCCALCTDELPLLQRTYILAYSVQAHTHCFADGPISESTLVGVSVLTATQARVDASALRCSFSSNYSSCAGVRKATRRRTVCHAGRS